MHHVAALAVLVAQAAAPRLVGGPLQDQLVRVGATLTWDVQFTGQPEPRVQWWRGDSPVLADNR